MCHVTFVEGRASRGMRGVDHKQPRYKLLKVSTLVHATCKITVQQNIQTDYTTDACKHATGLFIVLVGLFRVTLVCS
jgi:hypothetical protein